MPIHCEFDGFEVLPERRQVLQNGAPVALGARAFDLLNCLIAGRDRVVSKAELMDAVWPGLVVTENNLNVQILALRRLFGPRVAVTTPGRGFRFGLSLTPLPSQPQHASTGEPAPQPERRTRPSRRAGPDSHSRRKSAVLQAEPALEGASNDALDGASNGALPNPSDALEPSLPLPDKPSIAVLPFLQLGLAQAGGALDYFADAVAEDITTELSRFHSLLVISRNSAFTFKGRATDAREVGRQLGVHYVLEGSVRQMGPRIKVTAQLIDAQTGNHVWAEKYEREVALAFDVLEELPISIVSALAPQIAAAEGGKARRARPANLNAHGLALRSSAIQHSMGMSGDRAAFAEALSLARQALLLDRLSSFSWRVLAGAQWLQVYFNFAPSVPEALAEAIDACHQAISLDAHDHFAYTLQGLLSFLDNQPANGLLALRHAHDLNPNDAYTLCWLAFYEATLGNAALAEAYGQDALRRSPFDPMRHGFLLLLSGVYFSGGQYALGLHFAQRSKLASPNTAGSCVAMAINWVGLGHLASAKSAFDEALQLAPQLVQARLNGIWPSPGTDYHERANRFFKLASGAAEVKG